VRIPSSLSAEVILMPLSEYRGFNVDPDIKRKLITELSRIASEITEIPLEFFTVVIREVSGKEAFGQKGKPLG
jgi:phenylpyruvate tautomerase PptA (4-oxalocrotonate tautomerase family)